MIGGLETKPFAYACCLFALAALLQGRHTLVFFLLGLSVTFHVVVGLYATFCVIATMLCSRRRCAADWHCFLRSAFWFVLAAAPGGWVVLH
jgi:hypothetical protein